MNRDPRTESIDDLRWYYGRQYEGEMGLRAIDPGGTSIRGDPSTRGISEPMERASERFRRIRRRVDLLSDESQRVLSLAFDATPPRDLESYGPYPRAVLHCGLAIELHTESHSCKALLEWLRDRAKACKPTKEPGKSKARGLDKAKAVRAVERIRDATLAMVETAITEYAGAPDVPAAETVTVTQISDATGLSRPTVRAELDRRGILRNRVSVRAPNKVTMRMLWRDWSEVASVVHAHMTRAS